MKRKSSTRPLARKLAHLCLHRGLPAKNRVEEVLKVSEAFSPARRKRLLEELLYFLHKEMARHEAHIEHAGELEEAAVHAITENLGKAYGHALTAHTKRNDALLAGFRVRVADDIYDQSALGALNHLQRSLG